MYNKLHTTRVAVVKKLTDRKVLAALSEGKKFTVKCVEKQSTTSANKYFDLVEAGEDAK